MMFQTKLQTLIVTKLMKKKGSMQIIIALPNSLKKPSKLKAKKHENIFWKINVKGALEHMCYD